VGQSCSLHGLVARIKLKFQQNPNSCVCNRSQQISCRTSDWPLWFTPLPVDTLSGNKDVNMKCPFSLMWYCNTAWLHHHHSVCSAFFFGNIVLCPGVVGFKSKLKMFCVSCLAHSLCDGERLVVMETYHSARYQDFVPGASTFSVTCFPCFSMKLQELIECCQGASLLFYSFMLGQAA
jgi:hypothetical protein